MDSAALVTALRRRNPSHDGPLGAAHWRLVDDAVDGGGGFLAGLRDLRVYDYGAAGTHARALSPLVRDGETYLVQFPRETAEDFTERVRATTYDNHVAPVTRNYLGQLSASDPTRESSIPEVSAFWRDPDEGLGDVGAWMAEGSARALRHGWAACLIDRPEGVRPATAPGTMGRWLDPSEVIDWEVDDRGRFVWVKLCSEIETRDPVTGEESEREVVTIWTRSTWRRVTLEEVGKRWTITDDTGDVPHALGVVPVAVLRWVPPASRRDLLAPSVLAGSVSASLELFNVRSELRAIERDCVFPILCVATTEDISGTKLGSKSGMAVDPSAAFPAFISPDASVTIHYASRIEELTTRVYEAAYQERPSAQAQAPESGVSRGYRFRQMSALLVSAAVEHEAFEREVVSILAAWSGGEPAAWQAATTINYARRFDPLDAESVADTSLAVIEKGDQLVPEMVSQARAKISAALYPRLAPDAAARMREQLEARAERDRAAFDQTEANAALDAAVSALPAPAPGESVATVAGTTAEGTTPSEGE